jgi:hypothetical protein
MSTIHKTEEKLAILDHKFAELKKYVMEAAQQRTAIHIPEKGIFSRLLEMGRLLLEVFILQSGPNHDRENPPKTVPGQTLPYKGKSTRTYFSIFGKIKIRRARYVMPSGRYHYPLDVRLELPPSKYSYLLQKWLQAGAVENDYRESAERFHELFDFSFYPNTICRMTGTVSRTVDAFYEQSAAPTAETEGECLAIGLDGKGVRLVKSERAEPQVTAVPKARLGKGEKLGTKKEAMVTVDFSFHPAARSPEEIVKALLHQFTAEERAQAAQERQQRRQNNTPEPRAALNKHVRAFLEGRTAAIDYLITRLKKRDALGNKPIIALVDGATGLDKAITMALKEHDLRPRLVATILDIIHVTEYLWKAANALHGETGPERVQWIHDKLLDILESKVGRVIGGLKQIMTKNQLSATTRRTLQLVTTYLENHRHMMDYQTYLQNGYLISTGLVESACGSLVRDRMEQSGMRWTINGAKSILALRAVKKNGDWEQFWQTFIETQTQKFYADSYQYVASPYKKAA